MRILQRVCPHWWTEKHYPGPGRVMYDVKKHEKCVICGKHRVYAKVPEPHPTRDKDDVVDDLQAPGHEFIVDEWVPYDPIDTERSEGQ